LYCIREKKGYLRPGREMMNNNKFWLKTGILNIFVVICVLASNPSSAMAGHSPEDFYERYIGKSVDVDGYPASQPYQCYDLWAQFVMDEYGTSEPIVIGPTGCAEDIWYNFDGLGLDKYFKKVKGSPRDGDWVIYDWSENSSYSHVAMFREDNGDGTITVLHQNYLGQPEVTQDAMTTNYIVGYIRPKIYDGDYDDEEEVGDVTLSVSDTEITVGETITFSFSATGAETFTIRIYKDDTRIESKDCGRRTYYTREFSEPGEYYAYVKAYNDNDSARSQEVSFKVVPDAIETEPSPEITSDPPEVSGEEISSGARPVSVTVNGVPIAFDQPPIISNGRTLVPMRAIFEALETTVDWHVGKQMITAKKDDTTIMISIGSNLATVNEKEYRLDVPPQLINNRTLIPVRFISESLGAEVAWSIKTQTVLISMN